MARRGGENGEFCRARAGAVAMGRGGCGFRVPHQSPPGTGEPVTRRSRSHQTQSEQLISTGPHGERRPFLRIAFNRIQLSPMPGKVPEQLAPDHFHFRSHPTGALSRNHAEKEHNYDKLNNRKLAAFLRGRRLIIRANVWRSRCGAAAARRESRAAGRARLERRRSAVRESRRHRRHAAPASAQAMHARRQ